MTDREHELEQRLADANAKIRDLWAAAHPNHCPECGGWGIVTDTDNPAPDVPGSGTMPMEGTCPTCIGDGCCPHCMGELAWDEDECPVGHCERCGWNEGDEGRPRA